MNLFKNYKRLYEIELHNRKMLEDRKKQLSKENVDYQIKIQDQTNEIRTLKEEVAKLKICEKKETFTEISNELNFESIHYFTRFFKKKTGLTPKEYRKRYGK